MAYEDATIGTDVSTGLYTGKDGKPARGRIVDRDDENGMLAVRWEDNGRVGWTAPEYLTATK
jgi:hypothetical protein